MLKNLIKESIADISSKELFSLEFTNVPELKFSWKLILKCFTKKSFSFKESSGAKIFVVCFLILLCYYIVPSQIEQDIKKTF